jgi:hypothetical protein
MSTWLHQNSQWLKYIKLFHPHDYIEIPLRPLGRSRDTHNHPSNNRIPFLLIVGEKDKKLKNILNWKHQSLFKFEISIYYLFVVYIFFVFFI